MFYRLFFFSSFSFAWEAHRNLLVVSLSSSSSCHFSPFLLAPDPLFIHFLLLYLRLKYRFLIVMRACFVSYSILTIARNREEKKRKQKWDREITLKEKDIPRKKGRRRTEKGKRHDHISSSFCMSFSSFESLESLDEPFLSNCVIFDEWDTDSDSGRFSVLFRLLLPFFFDPFISLFFTLFFRVFFRAFLPPPTPFELTEEKKELLSVCLYDVKHTHKILAFLLFHAFVFVPGNSKEREDEDERKTEPDRDTSLTFWLCVQSPESRDLSPRKIKSVKKKSLFEQRRKKATHFFLH